MNFTCPTTSSSRRRRFAAPRLNLSVGRQRHMTEFHFAGWLVFSMFAIFGVGLFFADAGPANDEQLKSVAAR